MPLNPARGLGIAPSPPRPFPPTTSFHPQHSPLLPDWGAEGVVGAGSWLRGRCGRLPRWAAPPALPHPTPTPRPDPACTLSCSLHTPGVQVPDRGHQLPKGGARIGLAVVPRVDDSVQELTPLQQLHDQVYLVALLKVLCARGRAGGRQGRCGGAGGVGGGSCSSMLCCSVAKLLCVERKVEGTSD